MKGLVLVVLFIFISSAQAMELPPPLKDRIEAALVARKMSSILGVSCECPVYLGKCRYFHEHISLLVELDKQALAHQAKLD